MEEVNGMGAKRKNGARPVALTARLPLLVAGGSCFIRYLNARIFKERTTRLMEITSQARANPDASHSLILFCLDRFNGKGYNTRKRLLYSLG